MSHSDAKQLVDEEMNKEEMLQYISMRKIYVRDREKYSEKSRNGFAQLKGESRNVLEDLSMKRWLKISFMKTEL